MRRLLLQMEARRTPEGMTTPIGHRRTRIAELRAAVIRAHPDHGGTTESLQAALAALRTGIAEDEISPIPTRRAKSQVRRPRHRPEPPKRTPRGAVRGALTTAFWVYLVAMPIVLVLALLLARANAWLLGG
jgi:hypothetical protein